MKDRNKMKTETTLDMATIIANVYYGHQEARISNINRIRDLARKRMEDLPLNILEDKKEDKDYLTKYVDKNLEYILTLLVKQGKINTEAEEKFVEEFMEIANQTKTLEKKCVKMMGTFLSEEPLWKWLSRIKGISNVLAINLLRNFGYCENANHISSIWKYAGLDVVADDGKGRTRRKEHFVDKEFKTEDGKTKKFKGISFNARAKTVAWLVADSFVKQRTEPYRTIYDKEKERLANLEFEEGELAEKYNGYKAADTHLSKGHINNRAMRKMVKVFLSHYIVVARKLSGNPIDEHYVVKKMGHKPEHIIEAPLTEGLF